MPYRNTRRLSGDEKVLSVSNIGKSNQIIFRSQSDYDRFLTLLAKLARQTAGLGVIAYVLTANSFNIVIHEFDKNISSKFVHKLGVSYAMYFQNKYEFKGKLFKGPYKDKFLENKDSIMLEICRLHLLPEDFGHDPEFYKWSSYAKYLANRGPWLKKDLVKDYLKSYNFANDLRFFTKFAPIKE